MPTASRARAAGTAVAVGAVEQQSVDAAHERSLEFAPTGPPNGSPQRDGDLEVRRAPIAVGPGRPAVVVPAVPMEGGLLGAMPEFPIQPNKVQSPPLREDTLARDRLLDWLAAKIHDRVVLVIAEAGYGKTTLLADFSRQTRLRTLWYRLDRGDRDWVGFIAHLAAAVRVHVPDFGSATSALLRETATVPPTLDVVLDTFLSELGQLPADATVLILDDFHLVDDNDQIRHITKELLARAPERLTFVFASRRLPPVPLARLRALREVAELGTDDLRFDETETERLFRETYEMPLEPGLVTELSKRTEGWAASLQLVRTALHDRDAVQARAFIGSLSGAEGHLYDYLAEEVIGDLPADLQDFLMRTSILDTIEPDVGAVAAQVSPDDVRRFVAEAERLGLLSRRGGQSRSQTRSHPLVREFLQARLRRAYRFEEIQGFHRAIATASEGTRWRLAARHYRAAGEEEAAKRVVANSINEILATGAYGEAHAFVRSLGIDDALAPAGLVLASRVALSGANPILSLDLAERALKADPGSIAAGLTVMTARSWSGDLAGAVLAGRHLEGSEDVRTTLLARTFRGVIEASVDGSIPDALEDHERLLALLVEGVDDHFIGVARLNQANLYWACGNAQATLAASDAAIEHLRRTSAGIELISALLMRATALAMLARPNEWRAEAEMSISGAHEGQLIEALSEAAGIEVAFGSEEIASRYLASAQDLIDPGSDHGQQGILTRITWYLRRADGEAALADLNLIRARRLRTAPAFEARRLIALGLAQSLTGRIAEALRTLDAAVKLSQGQGAAHWSAVSTLLRALVDPEGDPNGAVLASTGPALSTACEAVLSRLADLGDDAFEVVATESVRRPERWRSSLRRQLEGSPREGKSAARLLAIIGEREDVSRLHAYARSVHGEDGLARSLARKLAARVLVEDLGRVQIRVGGRTVEGADVRRKVLALLCLLISRDKFAATREEVLDSLWPDLDPASALNSLNQTVYFLRRVFEPNFREETSPGYLRQDAETIWLDRDLVDARSRICRDLIREGGTASSDDATAALAQMYSGRFALDFQYEDWASAYRDTLHASYLRVMEQRIRVDMASGKFGSAIEIAERSVEVEPDSEEIQVELIKLYRLAGAHAAAMERYGHYAKTMQALGVDPPSFDAVVTSTEAIGTPAY